jgi:hypothetical protein
MLHCELRSSTGTAGERVGIAHHVVWEIHLLKGNVMALKTFKRIDNGEAVTINVTGYYRSPAGNIVAFNADGKHYHLHAHRSSTNHFPSAQKILKRAAVGGTTGGAAGAAAGVVVPGGGVLAGALVGAVAGSLVATLGPMVLESLKDHRGEMSYIDEAGREVYWGPVAA